MLLKVENGSFIYKTNEKKTFNNINIEVEKGDVLAVLGPNGAGKTTFLLCLMNMLKWKSGRAFLKDKPIDKMSHSELFSILSYVPQARNASGIYTGLEMVLLGRSGRYGIFSEPKEADVKIAKSVMERLHILYLENKRCSEISGGELQMILIARALASEPEVLILDEPESNLDFKNQLIVMDTITELAASGITCIFNTHYPTHAMQRANKALLLSNGTGIFGKISDVITEKNIEKSFGVRAVIGEIKTQDKVVRDIIPISVSG